MRPSIYVSDSPLPGHGIPAPSGNRFCFRRAKTNIGMKRKRAWLITWEILQRGAPTDVVDGQVVAFLDAKLSSDSVRQIMKSLWITCGRRTWEERLSFATSSMHQTFYSNDRTSILVGFKPRLCARLVEDLEVTDEETGGSVAWTEIVLGRLDEVTGRPPKKRRRVRQSKLPSAI